MQLSTMCSGMMLWVPIEKLFMSEVGFTASSVGLMAGVYAIVVPVLEIPSGLLADRWSRTRANRQPAAANYVREPGQQQFRAFSLDVLHIDNGQLVDITTFFVPEMFALFGLPTHL